MVLPTVSIAQLMLALLREYRKRFNNELLRCRLTPGIEAPLNVSLADCQLIVAAYWEEAITSRLCWMGGPVTADETIERVIPGYTEHEFKNRASSLRTEVLGPIYDLCDEAISQRIPDRSWFMWTVRPFACGQHILEEGADFRIYEWERMLKEKQISYPHIVVPENGEVQDTMTNLGFEVINEHLLKPRGPDLRKIPMAGPMRSDKRREQSIRVRIDALKTQLYVPASFRRNDD